MVRGMYTAVSGALVAQSAVDTIANNLANVNTAGFKRQVLIAQAQPRRELFRFQTDPSAQTGAPGVPANLMYRAIRGEGNPGAPVKDPEMTWAEVHATAREVLPGVRYRRHLLWRYSLRWRKPGR